MTNMTKYLYFYDFLFGSSRRLNNIVRFNTRHRSLSENVASHSYYVALYSLILSKILIQLGEKVNVEKVLTRALLHDIEECVAGDVLKNVKADPEMKKAYNKIAELSAKSVLSPLPPGIKNSLFSEWRHQLEGTEGWIVDMADELSGITYSREQLQMGNNYFKTIFADYQKRFRDLVENTILQDLGTTLVSQEVIQKESYEKDR